MTTEHLSSMKTSGELFTAKSLDYDEEPKSYKVRENWTIIATNAFAY